VEVGEYSLTRRPEATALENCAEINTERSAMTGKSPAKCENSETTDKIRTSIQTAAQQTVTTGGEAGIRSLREIRDCQISAKISSSPPAKHHTTFPELLIATMKRDLESIEALVRSGHDLEVYHPLNKRTAAIMAAKLGYDDVLEALLDAGADTSVQDRDGRTALHHAASEGNTSCTSLLLSGGAPPCIQDLSGETPLHLACHFGRKLDVTLLLSHSRDPLAVKDRTGRSALHIAAASGHANIIDIICKHLQSQASESICSRPTTPVDEAQGKEDNIGLVLDDKDLFDQSPLGLAVHLGNNGAAASLLEHGADFRNPCQQHHKCLLEEAIEIFTASILDCLQAASYALDINSTAGRVLFRESQNSGRWNIVREIVRHSSSGTVDLEKIFAEEKTWIAVISDSAESEIPFLLGCGLNLNAHIQTKGRLTDKWRLPIHVAALFNHIPTMDVLIRNGADIYSRDGWNQTPFYHVARSSDYDYIRSYFERIRAAMIKNDVSGNPASKAQIQKGRESLLQGLQSVSKFENTDKLEFLLHLIESEFGRLSWNGLVHKAVENGRVQMTTYLLERGCNPLFLDEKARLPTAVQFIKRTGHPTYTDNSREDYEKCKKLVQEAINSQAALRKNKQTTKSTKSSRKK